MKLSGRCLYTFKGANFVCIKDRKIHLNANRQVCITKVVVGGEDPFSTVLVHQRNNMEKVYKPEVGGISNKYSSNFSLLMDEYGKLIKWPRECPHKF